jgi:hypothetical protein
MVRRVTLSLDEKQAVDIHSPGLKNVYLSSKQKDEKLKDLGHIVHTQGLLLDSRQRALEDVRAKKFDILQELKRSFRRGTPEEIAYYLLQAQAQGKISGDQRQFMDVMREGAKNLNVKGQKGKRYPTTKPMYEFLANKWGGACAEFVALQVEGPVSSTIREIQPKVEFLAGVKGSSRIVELSVPHTFRS